MSERHRINTHLADRMVRSQIYQDYERAFTQASGLPLVLKASQSRSTEGVWTGGNSFCELMSSSNQICAHCLDHQKRLDLDSSNEVLTSQCFAGLCESAIPVRVENRTVAFLKTGHVFRGKPDRSLFDRLTHQLLAWGSTVDLKKAKEAWTATRVLNLNQYDAFVRMLQVFARHLEATCSSLTMTHDEELPPSVRQARQVILDRHTGDLSLSKMAKIVNLSAYHLCKLFKQSMGISFTEFVTKVRVEKACQLLLQSDYFVNEACYEAGFQSLSQFNRAFKKIMGVSPTEYRRKHSRCLSPSGIHAT